MKHRIGLLLLSALAFVATAFAEPVKLSNAEASRLFFACRSVPGRAPDGSPGVSAASAVKIAQNINLLRPYVEAFDAKKEELGHAARAVGNAPDAAARIDALSAEMRKAERDSFTVDLRTINLTDAEIEYKVAPDALAEFLRFLQPQPQPEKKK